MREIDLGYFVATQRKGQFNRIVYRKSTHLKGEKEDRLTIVSEYVARIGTPGVYKSWLETHPVTFENPTTYMENWDGILAYGKTSPLVRVYLTHLPNHHTKKTYFLDGAKVDFEEIKDRMLSADLSKGNPTCTILLKLDGIKSINGKEAF